MLISKLSQCFVLEGGKEREGSGRKNFLQDRQILPSESNTAHYQEVSACPQRHDPDILTICELPELHCSQDGTHWAGFEQGLGKEGLSQAKLFRPHFH